MRFSWLKLAKLPAPMAVISKPSNSALAKKYNYQLRQKTSLDDVHGYMYWCATEKFGELWPLVTSFVIYGCFTTYLIWWAFQKTEVQLNRFSEHRPWDWERAQHVFGKRKKAFYDDSAMWGRIPELDKLQAEMLEVKNQRIAAEKQMRRHH